MWLYMIALVLVVLGIVGGVASGGIFTIVLVPIGLIVAASAVFYGKLGHSATSQPGGEPQDSAAANRPLPHTQERDSGHAPTSPERLADARRSAQ
jgi:hypothetical protein